ncbi:hypothetical protein GCM10010172_02110 [Paractinoplanes ferrugineus]|uniref:Uncharacterized protein n=1 Tax=Paractinoplanes ferrugineus TaxID=113564 RepID=A0A919MFR7_9ACTN|nr:hypothetical protein [Actinoplanes ferrugineus]GIE14058.1 hypothetical protein Afe05nite_58980 [Actinoplanes ferrugineus]
MTTITSNRSLPRHAQSGDPLFAPARILAVAAAMRALPHDTTEGLQRVTDHLAQALPGGGL